MLLTLDQTAAVRQSPGFGYCRDMA